MATSEKYTSRFYKISAVALFEYRFNNKFNDTSGETPYSMIPLNTYSPFVYSLLTGERMYLDTLQSDDYPTGNTADITSIPYDSTNSVKFRITDSSVTYQDYETANKLFGAQDGSLFSSTSESLSFDNFRLYFVSGYNFDDVDGIYLNISVNGDDGNNVTICKMYLRKSDSVKRFKYLERPLIINNKIYDKYIEVYVPSVKYLSNSYFKSIYSFANYMNVSESTPLRVEFGEVLSDDIIDYNSDDTFDVIESIKNKPSISYNAILYKVSSENSCLLPQNANSDRLTAEIKINTDDGCLKFCGKWDDEELTPTIVRSFNKEVVLYDVGNVSRNVNLYDADDTDSYEWIAYHEIIATFYKDSSTIVDELDSEEAYRQVYSFTQPFDKSGTRLYDLYNCLEYKPIIKKDASVNNAVFTYNFKLVNIYDEIQFSRNATLTVTGEEINKYFNKTVHLDLSGVKNYNVFNKIEQVNQSISTNAQSRIGTQYTKVFYNVSDIVLDNNGEYVGTDTYTLTLSNSPKNYKFKFKKYDSDNNLILYNLSDYTLVLYSRDENDNDITIEPTYSTNMNMIMGEIEFNFSTNNIIKLKKVEKSKRFMSILIINNDNTKYSMFDFTYE